MEAVLDELAECADLSGNWNAEEACMAAELKEAINRFAEILFCRGDPCHCQAVSDD